MDHRHAARMSDRRDPICGMTGTLEHDGRWFCSEGCAERFTRHSSLATRHSPLKRFLDPWLWVPISGVLLATAGRWWPVADPASAIYLGYVRKVLAPFLIGVLLGGVIDRFVPKDYVVKLLSGPQKRVVARAALLGFLASTCSHGCLALSIELYRKGASTPAVVSFLLASPWASMALTLLLLSLFQLKGLVIVAAALGIAITTGLIFQRLDRRGLIDTNPASTPVATGFSIQRDLAARWRAHRWSGAQLAHDLRGVLQGMIPLGRMVLGWVQLGLVLGAVLGAVVPQHIFERWFGASALGLLLTLALAAVIEVCSEGTAPVAFELYRHTGALGNAFAFLMGGVVTDYTELAVVWTAIGRRTVIWMLVITLPLVFLFGLLLNRWTG